MKGTLTRWLIFSCCLLILLASMAWTTLHLLEMERERLAAARNAEVQERVRLALWRIDSRVSALLIRENARPVEHFRAFHAADQIYTQLYQQVPSGQVLAPSPLMSERPEHVRLFFEHGAESGLTSPQVPTGNQRDLAEAKYTDQEYIEAAAAELEQLDPMIESLLAERNQFGKPDTAFIRTRRVERKRNLENTWAATQARIQEVRSNAELQRRAEVIEQNQVGQNPSVVPKLKAGTKVAQNASAGHDASAQTETGNDAPEKEIESIEVSRFTPIWRGDELFLLRLVTGESGEEALAQGVWLDWSGLKTELESEAHDLFPAAFLEAVTTGEASTPAAPNRLASIPVSLQTGETPESVSIAFAGTPLRRSLLVAWCCILAAAGAVATLLYGAMALSERRGAFVSAVTHELRTPLTTFQLYTDLMAQGVAGDDKEKTATYLDTLRGESERLGHLVENVLAYAQLERGSARRNTSTVTLGELVDQVDERLSRRAAQSNMELVSEVSPEARGRKVKVDSGAVEQILYNLIDNACKYARPDPESESDGDCRIHLDADATGPVALLRVRDHGRGIRKSESRRPFRPFQKSALDAAHSAPGVGLGLALCRKMSEALGGKLTLEEASDDGRGACFVLELPAVSG